MRREDIRIMRCDPHCGKDLLATEMLRKSLSDGKNIRFIGMFKLGKYELYDKEKFLREVNRR